MTIKYVDYDLVVAINADYGGPGAGVRDEAGIRAQLGRVSHSGFMGEDPYPTLALKAAVLLHGLASTQFFYDGNKRTAWLTMNLFLSLNDAPLREVPVVAAEAIVLTVATRAFEVDPDGVHRAIEKTAEWVDKHQLRMKDRLDYAIVAQSARIQPGEATFDAEQAQFGGFWASSFPEFTSFEAIVRLTFRPEDTYRDWTLRAHLTSPEGAARFVLPNPATRQYLESHGTLPPGFDPVRDVVDQNESVLLAVDDISGTHEGGVVPSIALMSFVIMLQRPGRAYIVFTVNGQFLARRLLRVVHMPEVDPAGIERALRGLFPSS